MAIQKNDFYHHDNAQTDDSILAMALRESIKQNVVNQQKRYADFKKAFLDANTSDEEINAIVAGHVYEIYLETIKQKDNDLQEYIGYHYWYEIFDSALKQKHTNTLQIFMESRWFEIYQKALEYNYKQIKDYIESKYYYELCDKLDGTQKENLVDKYYYEIYKSCNEDSQKDKALKDYIEELYYDDLVNKFRKQQDTKNAKKISDKYWWELYKQAVQKNDRGLIDYIEFNYCYNLCDKLEGKQKQNLIDEYCYEIYKSCNDGSQKDNKLKDYIEERYYYDLFIKSDKEPQIQQSMITKYGLRIYKEILMKNIKAQSNFEQKFGPKICDFIRQDTSLDFETLYFIFTSARNEDIASIIAQKNAYKLYSKSLEDKNVTNQVFLKRKYYYPILDQAIMEHNIQIIKEISDNDALYERIIVQKDHDYAESLLQIIVNSRLNTDITDIKDIYEQIAKKRSKNANESESDMPRYIPKDASWIEKQELINQVIGEH